MDADMPPADGGRNETPAERADRKWVDLLQELRVMQTGAQLIAGFLLTLPFQSSFSKLDDFQRIFYLVLVVLAGLTTTLVMSPVAIHRRLTGLHVKERLVQSAGVIVIVALASVACLVIGIVTFIFDVVTDRALAFSIGGAMTLVVATLMVVIPFRLVGSRSQGRA